MNSKYELVLALHLVMIIADLCFNAVSTILFRDTTAQLMIFILQNTLIVMSIITTAITFSSTYVFQAGLISVLLKRFCLTFFVLFLYLTLSILLHFVSLHERWGLKRYLWSNEVTVLYVLQRTVAMFHYFLYKRTVLHLANPKFHFASEWLREKIGQRD